MKMNRRFRKILLAGKKIPGCPRVTGGFLSLVAPGALGTLTFFCRKKYLCHSQQVRWQLPSTRVPRYSVWKRFSVSTLQIMSRYIYHIQLVETRRISGCHQQFFNESDLQGIGTQPPRLFVVEACRWRYPYPTVWTHHIHHNPNRFNPLNQPPKECLGKKTQSAVSLAPENSWSRVYGTFQVSVADRWFHFLENI